MRQVQHLVRIYKIAERRSKYDAGVNRNVMEGQVCGRSVGHHWESSVRAMPSPDDPRQDQWLGLPLRRVLFIRPASLERDWYLLASLLPAMESSTSCIPPTSGWLRCVAES